MALRMLCLLAWGMVLLDSAHTQDDEQVTKWARELGDELWELGRQITKPDEIKREYSRNNARTLIKTGDMMLDDIVTNLERMLQQRMDAVQCVMSTAEESAEKFNFDDSQYFLYHSAKLSAVYYNGEPLDPVKEDEKEDVKEKETVGPPPPVEEEKDIIWRFNWMNYTKPEYLELWLEDRKPLFYGIPVNTTHSSVHVPDNVFDHSFEVQAGLQWSEDLNQVFRNNYAADPSLSWQFFGHSSGFMRIFPAMHWSVSEEEEKDEEEDNGTEKSIDTSNTNLLDKMQADQADEEYDDEDDDDEDDGDEGTQLVQETGDDDEEEEEEERDADLYDCRTREWYIEAATCTKDIVILVDNTGSMTGISMTIAHLTVRQLLETFGANDFVSVVSFNDTAKSVVDCFEGTLVQGTPENKQAFDDGLRKLKPLEYANLTHALIYAFDLLESFRENQSCPEFHCNQAIMVVTDGIAFNMTDFMMRYNRDENDTAPIRIFTYLLGKEVSKVKEIQEMACLNRGYYMHIHSMDEVREHVLKYIPVVARPLVLQEKDHPVRWAPAFADTADPKMTTWLRTVMREEEQRDRLLAHEKNKQAYFSERKEDNKYIQEVPQLDDILPKVPKFKEYRMMTTVSVPAFDRKWLSENETLREAHLLGVAGIDVPISDFARLTMPYSIGVNGYVFIVTNNGFILTHPDHRPVYRGVLKTNYNSVDLSEIEFADEEREPRDPSPQILELRESMVNHSRTHMQVQLKFHFDDMRRVDSEMKDIYIAPLRGTPFSIAMVLPTEYGHAWLKVAQDEFKKYRQAGSDPTTFFNSSRWRVHPDWDYCSYFHEDHLVFHSPEERVLHFVQRAGRKDWEWRDRWRYFKESSGPKDFCNKTAIDPGEYYCDRELMQLLVFDARLSLPYAKGKKWEPRTRDEQDLARKYNVMLRFISMQSGLTRWQPLQDSTPTSTSAPEWGDSNNRAIEEPWYVGGVLQHQINNYSFYFSMPSNTRQIGDPSLLSVTASHAIFHLDESRYVPASVVGYVMPHSSLLRRFENVTSKACKRCLPCSDDALNCYLLDSNGYVLASKSILDTGRFFGEIEGAVLDEMVTAGLFSRRVVYDYQALCYLTRPVVSAASYFLTPFQQLQWLWRWTLGRLSWLLLQSQLGTALAGDWLSEILQVPGSMLSSRVPHHRTKRKKIRPPEEEGEVFPRKPKPGATETVTYPCERKSVLYRLEQEKMRDGNFRLPPPECSRPYSARAVPNSNMLLVVTNPMKSNTCFRKLLADSEVIMYKENLTTPCQKMGLNSLPRRRLSGCYNQHPKEMELQRCGGAGSLRAPLAVAVVPLLLLLLLR